MTDFVQDLEAELLAAARRRAARRPRPRIAWRGPAVAVAVAAVLVAAVLTLRPSEAPPSGTPRPGAFAVPVAPPIRACDGTPPSPGLTTFPAVPGVPPPDALSRQLSVLRRSYNGGDQLRVSAPPPQTWLPVGGFDPSAVRRAGAPLLYLVPTSDLRTKPLACGGGEARGPGACLVAPANWACFTPADIREGRAFMRVGQHLAGVVPDGVRWVRLTQNNRVVGALATDNVVDQLGDGAPLKVAFERDVPRVQILNASRSEGRAARLADELEPLLGARPAADNAKRGFAQTTVFAIRGEDFPLANAIAHRIGAASGGNTASVLQRRFATPEDALVVVLGHRMR